MFTLIVENHRGDQMTITGNNNFAIDYLDGFYSSEAAISTAKIGTRDGEKISAKTLNKKNLGIYLKILQDVSKNRIDLYRIFQAKQKVTIYYKNSERNVKIEGYVENITIAPHQSMSTAQAVIMCPEPYFRDINDIIRSLSSINDNFTFPFAIQASGIRFSYIDALTQIAIENHGEVDTGMTISLRALDSVVNPFFYNEDYSLLGVGTTDLPYTMEAGEIIVFDTVNKTVKSTKNLVTTNIFNYLRPNSKWFQLKPGDNLLGSGATSGQNYMRTTINYSNKYEGV